MEQYAEKDKSFTEQKKLSPPALIEICQHRKVVLTLYDSIRLPVIQTVRTPYLGDWQAVVEFAGLLAMRFAVRNPS